MTICRDCSGDQEALETFEMPCEECLAEGWVDALVGPYSEPQQCDSCSGTGNRAPRSEDEALEWMEGWA